MQINMDANSATGLIRGGLGRKFFNAIFILFYLNQPASSTDNNKDYILGPQDKVEVRVYDLRSSSGEIHKWDAFDGDYSVDAAGNIILPSIGTVQAIGKTTSLLSNEIGSLLQQKIGLNQPPTPTIQIVKYRPFFILGDVEKPGEYEFRPRLTVLQAVGVAGGLIRDTSRQAAEVKASSISRRSDIRIWNSELISYIAKKARLEAEISGNEDIAIDQALVQYGNQKSIKDALSREKILLEARRSASKAKISSINATKIAIASELKTLQDKEVTLTRQVELTQKDLNQVKDLASRGLTVSTRELSAEQTAASFQNNLLDVKLAMLRGEQELGRLSRESLDLVGRAREENLKDLQETSSKISSTTEKIEAASRVLNITDSGSANNLSAFDKFKGISYNLRRYNPETSVARNVNDTEAIEPGDVLIVSAPASEESSR